MVLGDLASIPTIDRIELEPLSPRGVAGLAAGSVIDPGELHAATGGNPFFVTEVLATPAAGVPASVRAAVRGRLARLSDRANATVEALAVVGVPTPVEFLALVVPDAREGVMEAIDNGILRAGQSLIEFRHELARIAVLDTVPMFRQAELHRAALGVLVDGDVPGDQLARVVEHAAQVGDQDVLLRYAPLAGRHAAALGAFQVAAANYERALPLAESLPKPERIELLEAALAAYAMTGEVEKAVGCARRLLVLQREVGDRLAEGETLRRLALSLWDSGRTPEARRVAIDAVRVLELLPASVELARAYATRVQLTFFTQNGDAAQDDVKRAYALAARFDVPEIEAWTRYFATAATVAGRRKDIAQRAKSSTTWRSG